ncbi:MAG: hypothetical protein LBQ89_05115, partial [Treponema sp.]|nr:hypothetical protein [Treponema sp.]
FLLVFLNLFLLRCVFCCDKGGGGAGGWNNRTRPTGRRSLSLHVPAQENFTALNKMRLALANRSRRAKEEQMPDNVELTIFSKFPLF